jgi:hypothetical protein
MKKIKLYLDTSVISHLDAPDTPEKMADTVALWEDLKSRSDIEIVISELTLRELNKCWQPKLQFLLEKLNEFDYLFLEISEDDKNLANYYLKNAVLPEINIVSPSMMLGGF